MTRQTSIDTYKEIVAKGLLSNRRMEIYKIVHKYGPMTSNETFDYSELNGIDGYRHNANARMTELRELGVVEEVGIRECSKTGRNVIFLNSTGRLPVPYNKPPTTKQLLAKAVAFISSKGLTSEFDQHIEEIK